MSRRALFISNMEDRGRLLGQVCRASGIDPPGWCVSLDSAGAQLVSDAGIFILSSDEGGRVPAAFIDAVMSRTDRAAIVITGEDGLADTERLRVIRQGDGWADGVVAALIDLLGLTPALLASYENRLRVLGRELDRRGYAAVHVEETDDGFRVQPESGADAQHPSFEFNSRMFGRLARESRTARGEPGWERPRGRLATQGHERLLRHIGSDLDQRGAAEIRIVALAHSLVVSGFQSTSPYDPPEAFQEMYRLSDLQALQEQGWHRRKEPQGWMQRLARRLGIT